ncbi:MAG TPA: 2-hydroxychromene-2-carboxylate isomerase [Polyangiales bacterium]|nr:2-hydroxychromene-2-carboxylate isomerase [Polyangiales bacterium]
MSIEFWFEFASTYSYPAVMRVERAASEAGIPLVWRSFLLGPIFQAQGWDNSPFNIYPAKGRYMWRDLERLCESQGLAWKRPSVFPRGSLLASRIACRYGETDWIGNFVRDVYEANFVRDEAIDDPSVIARSLERVGQAPAAIIESAKTPMVKEQLRQQTEKALRLGIFGSPTLVVGDELFWGGDRIEHAIAWHARPSKSLVPAV